MTDLKNEIVMGDNVAEMKKLPDGVIDLVVTSPPYDDIRDYKGYSWDVKGIIEQLYRVVKTGGVVVWVVADGVGKDGGKSLSSFRQALMFQEAGFIMHDVMIYKKTGMRFPDPTRYHQNFEYMFVFSKGKPKTINIIKDRPNIYAGSKVARQTGVRQVDGSMKENSAWRLDKERVLEEHGARYAIWEISAGGGKSSKDKDAFIHPAIFPEALARDHIKSWSNPGDFVLDPFSGSGTTVRMAYLEGRNSIGIELSEEYVKLSKEILARVIETDKNVKGGASIGMYDL